MTFQNHTDFDGQLAARCFSLDLERWNKALSTDHTLSHCSLLISSYVLNNMSSSGRVILSTADDKFAHGSLPRVSQ